MARPFMGKPIIDAPRKVLRAIPGLKLVDMERHGRLTRCCGGSGGTRAVNSDISADIAKELYLEAERTGADTVLTNCPVCYLNLALRSHVAPNPVTDEWRKFPTSLKMNDITQYLAALL
jgi:Fe-S oxidoreductase